MGILLEYSRSHRRNPQPAEAALWAAVRGKQLGVKARRQHPFEDTQGGMIADFYFPRWKLVVELDGFYHRGAAARARDAARSARLEAKGLRVIRFWNSRVIKDLPGVLAEIRRAGEGHRAARLAARAA